MDQSFKLLPTNNTGDFRALMYETTAPNTAVAFVDVLFPHTVSQLIQFTNLNEVAHFFRLYELLAGDTLGQLLTDDIVQPQAKSIAGKATLTLTVGVELTEGTDTYNGSTDHVDLVGLVAGVNYDIEERGIGTLRPEEFQDIGQSTPSFGFKLTNGRTFNDQDTFFIHFLSKLISVPSSTGTSPTSGNKLFSDIVEINADTSLDSSYIGKLVDCNSSTSTLVITLDLLASFLDNALIGFKQHRGSQFNTVIQARSGETIYYRGDEVNEVIIAMGEHVYFSKKNSKWHVVEDNVSKEVGLPILNWSTSINTIAATGQLVNRADYPRLWAYVNTLTNGLVSDSTWNAAVDNQKQFSTGNGSTTFRLPDLTYMFFRAAGLGRNPGSYQKDAIKDHRHSTPVGTLPSTLFGRFISSLFIGKYGGTGTGQPDLTSSPTDASGNPMEFSTETRPYNVAFTALIKI